MNNINKNNQTPYVKVDESPLHPYLEAITDDIKAASKRINDFIDLEINKLLKDHPSIEVVMVFDSIKLGTKDKYVTLVSTIGERR